MEVNLLTFQLLMLIGGGGGGGGGGGDVAATMVWCDAETQPSDLCDTDAAHWQSQLWS